jgi:hypothetical protein
LLRHERGDSRRHRRPPGAQLDERPGEPVDQRLEVEQPTNLVLREDEQRYPRICEKRITVTVSSSVTSRL